VVRHPLVQKIVVAYERLDERRQAQKMERDEASAEIGERTPRPPRVE